MQSKPGISGRSQRIWPHNPPLLSSLHMQLSLGCDVLDSIFDGGLNPGTITEFCGEAGVGKSNLLLQLMLMVQLPREHGGLGGSAACVLTESDLPFRRLDQMQRALKAKAAFTLAALEARAAGGGSASQDRGDEEGEAEELASMRRLNAFLASHDFAEHVFVRRAHSVAEQCDAICKVVPQLAAQQQLRVAAEQQQLAKRRASKGATSSSSPRSAALPLRLVVIDSIAALVRVEFGGPSGGLGGAGERGGAGGDMAWRNEMLADSAASLLSVGERFGAVVVVANQVADAFASDSETAGAAAALGARGMGMGARAAAASAYPFVVTSSARAVKPTLGLAWGGFVTARVMLARATRTGSGDPALEFGDAEAVPAAAAADAAAAGATAAARGEGEGEGEREGEVRPRGLWGSGEEAADGGAATLGAAPRARSWTARSMVVVMAPHLPPRALRFFIADAGVRGVPGSVQDVG